MNGIDNINMFNGNLTVTLPIGSTYQRGGVSYALTLVYSGNVWDSWRENPNSTSVTIVPNRRANAGLGWLLSLGRLVPPFDPTNEAVQPFAAADQVWIYEGSDGHDHPLYPTRVTGASSDGLHWYSRDDTHLRMTKIDAQTRHVEFPDGTWQVFKELAPSTATWGSSTAGAAIWKLTEIQDRFSNVVSVSYSSNTQYPEMWTITDGSRTHVVYFKSTPIGCKYPSVLAKVELTTFGAALSTWTIESVVKNVTRGPGDTTGNSPSTYSVPLLTKLTLPGVGGAAAVSYTALKSDDTPAYELSGPTTGHLLSLQLPTGGGLEWAYSMVALSGGALYRQRNNAVAVMSRKTLTAARTQTALWKYQYVKSAVRQCTYEEAGGATRNATSVSSQLVSTVTAPDGVTAVHYFSVNDGSDTDCPVSGAALEYGLPFSPDVTDDAGRFLSTETRLFGSATINLATGPNADSYRVAGGTLLRAGFVKYDYETFPTAGGSLEAANSRVTASATSYADDLSCGTALEPAPCRTTTRSFAYDGFGHFKQTSTGGDLADGSYRTTFTNYDTTLNSAGDWSSARLRRAASPTRQRHGRPLSRRVRT